MTPERERLVKWLKRLLFWHPEPVYRVPDGWTDITAFGPIEIIVESHPEEAK